MKLDPLLSRAARLARSGNYDKAIKTLEPEVNRYHGSFNYYYILAVSCLYAEDFGGAHTYFKLAREVKLREPKGLLGMAVLYLRRGDTDRAVDLYLEVQEIDEKNVIAKKALKVIRKYAGNDTLSDWREVGKISSLYPPIPFAGFSWRVIFGALAVLLAVGVFAAGIMIKSRVVANPFAKKGGRAQITELALSAGERSSPVQTVGSFRYVLTRNQALETYEKALSLFTSYRDEAAKINLNRILESNASDGLINKSRILFSYMETPGFDTFKKSDNISYIDVVKNPDDIVLYRDVHVIWRGMASNIELTENEGEPSVTTFDFLVGYDTRKTLEGIVPVVFDRAVSVNPERPLEVLGRIVPISSGIRLDGLAIHQSGLLENQ